MHDAGKSQPNTWGVSEVKTKANGAENAVAKDAKWRRKDEVTQLGDESEIDSDAMEETDLRLSKAQGAKGRLPEAAEAVEQARRTKMKIYPR